MEVKIQNTRAIKPIYEGIPPHQSVQSIPLTVFDKVNYNTHIAVVYAYRPPTPPHAAIESGLKRALSEYREWAGRLGQNEDGDAVILLNDKGVKFVEASVDSRLDDVLPSEPTSALLRLHPGLEDVDELMQIQLTRFACGSLVLGFTTHHLVGDAQSAGTFLVAWGKASRGLDISPLPFHDRTIFNPREPPYFEFEHNRVEYKTKDTITNHPKELEISEKDIVIHRFHFTLDFLSKLKSKASSTLDTNNNNIKPYSTVESLVAHLWRSVTKARGLQGSKKTHVRISVNGRMRMKPRVPDEYIGNLVLWTYPSATVNDLLAQQVSYAAKIIHDNLAGFNNKYFQSFIDFATHNVKEEGLVPTADTNTASVYPNIDVDSWLRLPFDELDFGGGSPYLFMPSYFPVDGVIFLLPSLTGDGGIVAVVPLFKEHMLKFKQIVFSLD